MGSRAFILLRHLAALALICASTGFSPSAEAAPLWLQPSNIAASPFSFHSPAIAINATGEAAAAWESSHGGAQAAVKEGPGGQWHTSRSMPSGLRPQVAIDGQGNAIAVWERWEGEQLFLESSFRPTEGSWQPLTVLSGDLGEGQDQWDLVMNARGEAALIWTQYRTETFAGNPLNVYKVFVRTMAAASGEWSPPAQLSSTGNATDPDIALDGRGDALAVWSESAAIRTAVGSASTPGAWRPATTIYSGYGGQLQAAMGPRGDAAVVWTRGSRRCGSLVGSTLPHGGDWSTPEQMSRSGECAFEPQLAVDARGRALTIWDGARRVSSLRVASASTATGQWKPQGQLATIGPVPTGDCLDLCPGPPLASAQLATSPDGSVAAAWIKPASQTGDEPEIHAAYLLPGSTTWERSPTLSEASNAYGPPPSAPGIAIGSRKHVVVVWSARNMIQADELAEQGSIRAVSLTRRRFPAGDPTGTRLRFQISAPARLRVAIAQILPGRLLGARCVPVSTTAFQGAGPHCTHRRFIGVVGNRIQRRGRGSLRIGGRPHGRPFKAGLYEAVLVVQHGENSSEPVALPFRVVPPR